MRINDEIRRITLKELYELFEDEKLDNGVWIKEKPKVNVKVYSFDPENAFYVISGDPGR